MYTDNTNNNNDNRSTRVDRRTNGGGTAEKERGERQTTGPLINVWTRVSLRPVVARTFLRPDRRRALPVLSPLPATDDNNTFFKPFHVHATDVDTGGAGKF